MISIFISAIKIIFLLGFLIGIHETGHFLIAKLCKVRVNEFAIGFGPTIWKKQGKETKYALRLVPLGGFVSMEGEEEHSDKEGSFSKASIPKRIAIVSAGALVNIIFALIIYFILSSTAGNNVSTIVDSTLENYAAQNVGIQAGDKILKVNNKKVRTSTDVNSIMQNNNGEEVTVTIKRNGEKKDITLKPTEVKYKSTGIYLYDASQKSTKIAGLVKGSSAEKQGLKTGDKIIKVNNELIEDNPEKLIELLNNQDYDQIDFVIERNNQEIEITVIPDDESVYYLGVIFQKADNTFINNIYYGFWNTGDYVSSIVDNLKQLFTGKVSTDQLMGPVGISEVVAKTNGFKEFIYMLALISMSLGVTNLIPFPPLDGGKILMLIIEGIRKKPLNQELEVKIQLLGFAILITLSIYITYNDVLRIF